ncbi:MAG: nucleoside hydrolase [Chthoniobacteraceae bacterium]|nr:nucleoside hydrolase [Chthoniobacteraceae bacterium]
MKTPPVSTIFDTDMSGDCDDTGALAVLHKLADRGEAEVLACVVNGIDRDRAVAASVSAVNTYYGRPGIPIGVYQGDRCQPTDSLYTAALRDEFPHHALPDDQMPAAPGVYRAALAAAPDGSVTIISVGFLINLRELMESQPDAHSPLAGMELVRRKVKHVVLMGGDFPQSGGEYNLAHCGVGPDSQFVIENWPTRILFLGWEIGNRVKTGNGLAATPVSNPVRRAYELYHNVLVAKRPSWDLMTVLAAVRGAEPLWTVSSPGYCEMAANGANGWVGSRDRGHAYLIEKETPEAVARALEEFLAMPPGR